MLDACGVAGGKAPPRGDYGAQYFNTSFAKQGDRGSEVLPPAPSGVTWTAGTAVEARAARRLPLSRGGGLFFSFFDFGLLVDAERTCGCFFLQLKSPRTCAHESTQPSYACSRGPLAGPRARLGRWKSRGRSRRTTAAATATGYAPKPPPWTRPASSACRCSSRAAPRFAGAAAAACRHASCPRHVPVIGSRPCGTRGGSVHVVLDWEWFWYATAGLWAQHSLFPILVTSSIARGTQWLDF